MASYNLLPSNYAFLNHTTQLSAPADERLVGMKNAFDSVHEFYRWISADYRRLDDREGIIAEMEKAFDVIVNFLDLTAFTRDLPAFFFICALRAIREESSIAGNKFPLNIEEIEKTFFDAQAVADQLKDQDSIFVGKCCGIFFLEGDAIDSLLEMTLQTAREGIAVCSDDVFTLLDDLDDILECVAGSCEDMTMQEQSNVLCKQIFEVYNHEIDSPLSEP